MTLQRLRPYRLAILCEILNIGIAIPIATGQSHAQVPFELDLYIY